MKNDIEDSLWNAMLDSEMNALYYGYLARRYEKRERIFQIFVAVLATSSISTLQLWKQEVSWFKWVWLLDALSILAITISVSLPFTNFSKISSNASSLRTAFQLITNKYESLWLKRNKISEEFLLESLAALKDEEIKQTNIDSTMPRDTKLLEKCQDQIIKAKNLI